MVHNKHHRNSNEDDFLQPGFIGFLMRHPTATMIVSWVLGSLLGALLISLFR